MSKYKIYKNKRTKYHPSIHVCINVDGKWENIEITSSPRNESEYEKFDVNPNPNWSKRESWFRKYIRKDPINVRGKEYKNYRIIKSHEDKIDNFLKEKKKAVLITADRGAKRLNHRGNQANHRINGQTSHLHIKPKRTRKHKGKQKRFARP